MFPKFIMIIILTWAEVPLFVPLIAVDDPDAPVTRWIKNMFMGMIYST